MYFEPDLSVEVDELKNNENISSANEITDNNNIDYIEVYNNKNVNNDKNSINNNAKKKDIVNKDSINKNIDYNFETINHQTEGINSKSVFGVNKIFIEDLKADPYKGAFYYKNYKYLPYTTKSQIDNVKEISFICNINKRDVNNRKGLKRLCYGTYIYIMKKHHIQKVDNKINSKIPNYQNLNKISKNDRNWNIPKNQNSKIFQNFQNNQI